LLFYDFENNAALTSIKPQNFDFLISVLIKASWLFMHFKPLLISLIPFVALT